MKCKNTAVDFCLKSWTVKRIVDCKFNSIDISDMVWRHELMRISVGFSFMLIGIPMWASVIPILFKAIELSFSIHFRFNFRQQKTEVRNKSKIIQLVLPANTKMESMVGNFEIPERGIHLVKLELFTYNNAPPY